MFGLVTTEIAGGKVIVYTFMRKNIYILNTIQDELKLSSDMKSTLKFGLEECIYNKYLNFNFFHPSPIVHSI